MYVYIFYKYLIKCIKYIYIKEINYIYILKTLRVYGMRDSLCLILGQRQLKMTSGVEADSAGVIRVSGCLLKWLSFPRLCDTALLTDLLFMGKLTVTCCGRHEKKSTLKLSSCITDGSEQIFTRVSFQCKYTRVTACLFTTSDFYIA